MASHTLSARKYYPQVDLSSVENDIATNQGDIATLQGQVAALQATSRILGTNTPIAGPGATSWSNQVTVSNEDGIATTSGDGTIIVGVNWCLCFFILEGVATASTGLGNTEYFTVDVDFPTNVSVLSTTTVDRNMVAGFVTGHDGTATPTTILAEAVVICTKTAKFTVLGQWHNRVGTDNISLKGFFYARCVSTAPARDYSTSIINTTTILGPNPYSNPTTVDIIEAEDVNNGGIFVFGRGVIASSGFGASVNDITNPPSGAGTSVTATLGSAVTKITSMPVILAIQGNEGYLGGQDGPGTTRVYSDDGAVFDFRLMHFNCTNTEKNTHTPSIVSVIVGPINTVYVGQYHVMNDYVFLWFEMDTGGTAQHEVVLTLPPLKTVSPGCEVMGCGFATGGAFLPGWSVYKNPGSNIEFVCKRLISSTSAGNPDTGFLVVYHTDNP